MEKLLTRSAWISLIVSICVFIFKLWAYFLTGSTAVLSDALESIVNVVAAFVALIVMKAVEVPADNEHPYGHGKLEYFSSAFEGGLVAFAAFMIGVEAVRALKEGRVVNQIDYGSLTMLAAAAINLILGLYLKSIGKKHKSEALKASGSHVISDVTTSVGVVIGLGLVKLTGWQWLDPLAALGVAVHLCFVGYGIVRSAMSGLLDEYHPESLRDLAAAITKVRRSGFIDIHKMRLIRSGRFHHVDAHLVVPEFWPISKTHNEIVKFENDVVKVYPYDGEIAFHLDPCDRKFCEYCDLSDCPIRVQEFKKYKELSVEALVRKPEGDNH